MASLISECLSAGTGCQWCVPFLKYLHTCHIEGREPDLKVSPEEYAKARLSYHRTDVRDEDVVKQATEAIKGEGEKQSGLADEDKPA